MLVTVYYLTTKVLEEVKHSARKKMAQAKKNPGFKGIYT